MTCIKICGLTRVQDAILAAVAGADMLGFVFYPPSPRYVKPAQVRPFVQTIHRLRLAVCCVGIFVDESLDHVRQTMDHCKLDYAQLHGAEPPEMTAALLADGYNVIKAFRVRDGTRLEGIERYRVTAYLLDTYHPGRPGGTGQVFDWMLASEAKSHGPIILAGGLTPDNVAQAVRSVGPWGVDVSSGVEMTPGRKDLEKVRRFIAAVRGNGSPHECMAAG